MAGRVSAVLYVLIALAMIGMIWPHLMIVPGWLQAVVFVCATLYFLWLSIAPLVPSRWRPAPAVASPWAGPAYPHHALMAATMTWMLLPSAHAAAAMRLDAILGGYFLLAMLPGLAAALGRRRVDRDLPGSAVTSHAVMSCTLGLLLVAVP